MERFARDTEWTVNDGRVKNISIEQRQQQQPQKVE